MGWTHTVELRVPRDLDAMIENGAALEVAMVRGVAEWWRILLAQEDEGDDYELIRVMYPNRGLEYIATSWLKRQYLDKVIVDVYRWDNASGELEAFERALRDATELALREAAINMDVERPERTSP